MFGCPVVPLAMLALWLGGLTTPSGRRMTAKPEGQRAVQVRSKSVRGSRKVNHMSEAKSTSKAGRPSRSLDEEIAAAAAKLQLLRDRKKEEERRERDRNQKAIQALIKDEGLDAVSIDAWKLAMPKVRKLLLQNAPPEPEAPTQASTEAAVSK